MGEIFYLYKSGRIKRKDNTIEIVYKDNTKRSLPVERISDLYIMSEFDFNTDLLNYISRFGINIHFFNYYGFYTGTYYPKENLVSGKLLIKQSEAYLNMELRTKFAKEFIKSASFNIYRNLRYYSSRGKELKEEMQDIELLRKKSMNVRMFKKLWESKEI